MATSTETTPAADTLRSLDADELLTRLREAKEELFNLRFQSATGQLDNNRRLKLVRRSIARIYTVMRERELGIYPAEQQTGATAGSTKDAAAESTAGTGGSTT